MRKIGIIILISFAFYSCNNAKKKNTQNSTVDIVKRDIVVKKYNLLNFENVKKPILISVKEFFDGNNDIASIAPNLIEKPKISEYYKVFKELLENEKVENIFVNIKDINIYENGKLENSEWFYSDIIYIVGKIDKQEVIIKTKKLKPSEVDYDTENTIKKQNKKYSEMNVIYVFWN